MRRNSFRKIKEGKKIRGFSNEIEIFKFNNLDSPIVKWKHES